MKRLPQILMILASLLLLGVFLFPLWRISLYAPQYPDGINMYIWVNQITGDTDYTLQNINILNHYIGMKYIEPESIPELTYFPYIVGVMSFLGLIAAYTKKRVLFFTWAGIMVILGALGIYDFYLWEYDYGHNLDPDAPIKIPGMVYQPPLIGSKMLLNFDASSWPHIGSLFLGLSIIVAVVAGILQKKNKKTEQIVDDQTKGSQKKVAFASIFTMLLLASCSSGPNAIYYGEENCRFCQMTIVDQRYAAQLVTSKGKAYNFDAVECLINFEKEGSVNEDEVANRFVTTFDQPGELNDIQKVTFVHTEALPSPMGMNLTAFLNEDNIPSVKESIKKFTWDELYTDFDELSNDLVNLKLGQL